MDTSILCISVIYLVLLLSSQYEATARNFPYSSPSTTTMEIKAKGGEYVTVAPEVSRRNGVLHEREIRNCMPKGFRHSSAPSRYVNYHTLGSLACLTGRTGRHSKKP